MDEIRFIRNFVYVIGGFTQDAADDSGVMRLWARLFRWRAACIERGLTLTTCHPRWGRSQRLIVWAEQTGVEPKP